jgi:type III secretion protein C
VDDRTYSYRGQTKIMQGIATTINNLFSNNGIQGKSNVAVKKKINLSLQSKQGSLKNLTLACVQNLTIMACFLSEIKVLPFQVVIVCLLKVRKIKLT